MKSNAQASFEREVQRAVRPYTAPILFMYDVGVYDLWNPYVWQCPSECIVDFYRKHVRAHHLEAGCGTGYLPDHGGAEPAWTRDAATGDASLTLLDYSPESVRWSARRLQRFHPKTLRHNLFEPLPKFDRPFDSACLNYVLHCLPGSFETKQVVLGHLKAVLAPEGVLFGSTILGHAETPSALGRRMLDFYNFIGSFHNAEDHRAALEQALARHFDHVHVHTVGAVALFAASDAALP